MGTKARKRSTQALHSQLVVEVLVDLLRFAVLAEHTAEDTHAALPDKLEGQASVGGTPALTGASVPPFPETTERRAPGRPRKDERTRGAARRVSNESRIAKALLVAVRADQAANTSVQYRARYREPFPVYFVPCSIKII